MTSDKQLLEAAARAALPEDPVLRERLHGTGDKGLAFYQYEDDQGLGIVMNVRRENRRSRFVTKFQYAWLPHQEFSTYAELRAAVDACDAKTIDAEQRKWPQLLYVRSRPGRPNGSCWLHKDRDGLFLGSAATCWIPTRSVMARLCPECAETARLDPRVIIQAGDRRKDDVAARAPGILDSLAALCDPHQTEGKQDE